MDVSGGLALVNMVLQVLNLSVWSEIYSIIDVKSDLTKLKTTMSTIESMFRDAEQKERLNQGGLSHMERDRLERLKEALYQADDLFDEVITLALRKKLDEGNKFSKEVRLFFSSNNQLWSAFTCYRDIKKIRSMLDDIVKDHQIVAPVTKPAIVAKPNDETDSFLTDVVMGRETDKRNVIDMLHVTSDTENVSFLSIYGIGGMGKTALAKFVCNDNDIIENFPLRMWICVSDNFDVEMLLRRIYTKAADKSYESWWSKDELKTKLEQELIEKTQRYLLVLDDVWSESEEKWKELAALLATGGKGSRILVTTRSKKVAEIVANKRYELKGLSEEDSWNLFEKMTLEEGQDQMQPDLVDIGKKILKKCANAPLPIKVIGSFLRKEDKSRWQSFIDIDLAHITPDANIMGVYMISYYNLPFHLKNCFAYCALFPKDYKIMKDQLICLWMAQGFISPSGGQSLEDAGERYFKILLERCFFQDVELGDSGEIISCKMHDLIHDLAKQVAGEQIMSYNYIKTEQIHERTRHLFRGVKLTKKDIEIYTTNMKRMRTLLLECLLWNTDLKCLDLRNLRALSLHGMKLRVLPSMIGNLLHLRYLDLSDNAFSELPTFISNLYNLQTLNLRECGSLQMLPSNFTKLVNLRYLDIHQCINLKYMPPWMSRMTSLHTITMLVVSGDVWRSDEGQLSNLELLINNHSELMKIQFKECATYAMEARKRKKYLLDNRYLREIEIVWEEDFLLPRSKFSNERALLKDLQPPKNIRKLMLDNYPGVRFPRWNDLETGISNLVELRISFCESLKQLPLLSQVPHLKVLELESLYEVEYVESRVQDGSHIYTSSRTVKKEFFPSLEKLKLQYLRKLKGWWKEQLWYSFPKLSSLVIDGCREMKTFPLCPNLEELILWQFNGTLSPIFRGSEDGRPSSSNMREEQGIGRLKKVVYIDDVGYLNSLPLESFHRLSHIVIHNMESMTTWKAFQSGRLSSLQFLKISSCKKLKTVSGQGVWEHLTNLETLELCNLPELELEDEKEEKIFNQRDEVENRQEVMPWRFLSHSLRSLKLFKLPKLEKLPKGMFHLTSLKSLRLDGCKFLKSLPEEMQRLKSLQELQLRNISKELKERCQSGGVDRPHINHIPIIRLGSF